MASTDSFQETCERKSADGRQIELIRILWMVCGAVQVRGGFDETIIDYSLPKNIRRLPFFRYTVTTRVAMKPEIVNQRVTRAVKEHMGDIEHIVCPDKLKGSSTETHTFLIISPTGLNYSLEKLLPSIDEAKDALSVLYNASKDKSASWKRLTPKVRVYIRFQVGAYILCSASDLDLAENTNWKQLEKSLTRSLSESVKSDTGVHRALETLMDAARKISGSNSPLEKGTNPPQDSSPLRGSTKRQRPSDLEDDVQRDAFSRLVRPRSGGDGSGNVSEQNAFDGSAFDGLPASVLPQPTCQGTPAAEFLPGFNGVLPRRPDNGVQHDALRLVQPERKGSGTEMSSGQGYNNAIFDGFPDSVLTQPTCQGIPAAEFLSGFNGMPRCSDNGVQHDALRLVQPEGKGSGIDMSSGQGYNNAIFAGFPASVLPQPTCQGIPAPVSLPGFNSILPRRPDNGVQHDASRQISTGRQQDELCRLVRMCSSMLLQAHALGLLSIDKRAMLVHITHESLKKDLKAVCEKKNDEMTAVSTLAGMRGRK